MQKCFAYDTVAGRIGIYADENALVKIEFNAGLMNAVLEETPLIKEAYKQLDEYFNGKRKSFDLPLKIEGTPFQKRVWQALTEIPYGQTRSYKQIAAATGNEKACRAVGMANNKNKLPIIIPCHRVIGANGSMVGFGCGIEIKEILLDLERKNA